MPSIVGNPHTKMGDTTFSTCSRGNGEMRLKSMGMSTRSNLVQPPYLRICGSKTKVHTIGALYISDVPYYCICMSVGLRTYRLTMDTMVSNDKGARRCCSEPGRRDDWFWYIVRCFCSSYSHGCLIYSLILILLIGGLGG